MFCAFEGPPKIVRLHGTGDVVAPGHPEFSQLRSEFPDDTGTRCIIRLKCQRISDSCGFGVPLYEYRGERSLMIAWAKNRGREGILKYQRERDGTSLDGLVGLIPREDTRQ